MKICLQILYDGDLIEDDPKDTWYEDHSKWRNLSKFPIARPQSDRVVTLIGFPENNRNEIESWFDRYYKDYVYRWNKSHENHADESLLGTDISEPVDQKEYYQWIIRIPTVVYNASHRTTIPKENLQKILHFHPGNPAIEAYFNPYQQNVVSLNENQQTLMHEFSHLLRNNFNGRGHTDSGVGTEHEREQILKAYPFVTEPITKGNDPDGLSEHYALNSEIRSMIIEDTGLTGSKLDEYINNLSKEDILQYLKRLNSGYIRYKLNNQFKFDKEAIIDALKNVAFENNKNMLQYANKGGLIKRRKI